MFMATTSTKISNHDSRHGRSRMRFEAAPAKKQKTAIVQPPPCTLTRSSLIFPRGGPAPGCCTQAAFSDSMRCRAVALREQVAVVYRTIFGESCITNRHYSALLTPTPLQCRQPIPLQPDVALNLVGRWVVWPLKRSRVFVGKKQMDFQYVFWQIWLLFVRPSQVLYMVCYMHYKVCYMHYIVCYTRYLYRIEAG